MCYSLFEILVFIISYEMSRIDRKSPVCWQGVHPSGSQSVWAWTDPLTYNRKPRKREGRIGNNEGGGVEEERGRKSAMLSLNRLQLRSSSHQHQALLPKVRSHPPYLPCLLSKNGRTCKRDAPRLPGSAKNCGGRGGAQERSTLAFPFP